MNGGNYLYAVTQAWAEENHRMSQWSDLIHSNANMDDFLRSGFPVQMGKVSIACGDWASLT